VEDGINFSHINKLEEFSPEEGYQCKCFTVQNRHRNQ